VSWVADNIGAGSHTIDVKALVQEAVNNNTMNGFIFIFAANSDSFKQFYFDSYDHGAPRQPASFHLNYAANSPPVAVNQSISFTKTSSTSGVRIALRAFDADGDPLTYALVTPPSRGTLSGIPPAVSYWANADFFGIDGFTFVATDGKDTSNVATVIITVEQAGRVPNVPLPANSPPVADNQNISFIKTSSTTNVSITLRASDPDGDPLTYAVVTLPSHGLLSGVPPALSYRANAGFIGTDNFTFTASDGNATSNVATVNITVGLPAKVPLPANRRPVAANQSISLMRTSSTSSVRITLRASDSDGDPMTYAVVTRPSHGTLSGSPPALSYKPNAGFIGTDNFTFTASDGKDTSNLATVTITVAQAGSISNSPTSGKSGSAPRIGPTDRLP
ncbi:MAG: tandem-95 repeat protein, partial [Chloroflexi bacterium]|nr:tandem-95 repeat protein [Chloroflexota bacterium]